MANVEFRIMPNGEEGRWYWEASRTAARLLRVALLTRNPLRVSKRMKRRKKRS